MSSKEHVKYFLDFFLRKNWRRFWVQHIPWISKILFCFWIEAYYYFFFEMVIFATLFRRCPTLWKSKLKTTTLFRRCLKLFNSTLKYTTLFQRCRMLIWRCATSRRHINLKATLNRRWNVCWVWRFSSSVWTIFVYFSDVSTSPCFKETNDVNT